MPYQLIILRQSDFSIQIVDINLDTKWQTVQIQIRSQLTAFSEANWSGSTLFAKAGYIGAQQDKG